MFTGLVEETGQVRDVVRADGAARLVVACGDVLDDAEPGSSISVSGCGLTVVEVVSDAFAADLMGETLERTTLGALPPGALVNLERPVHGASGRFGGHIVQGHIDAVGQVTAVEPAAGSTMLEIEVPGETGRYVVAKGSVAVDGVSLTVVSVEDRGGRSRFRVGIIPHTAEVTTLGAAGPGTSVNVEADVVAKYVERLAEPHAAGRSRHG
jgi:riboflavin synthase